MAAYSTVLVRCLVRGFILVGTALLVYHKRVGLEDAEGPSAVRLLLRPDLWLGAAVGLGVVGMIRRCLVPAGRFPPAVTILRNGPWLALGTAGVGTLAGWYWYGEAINKFGVQASVRLVLCAMLGTLVYNLATAHERFARQLAWIFVVFPFVNVAFAVAVLLSPSLVQAVFGAGMLVEGDGLFSLGARYQGLTSNPNMVAGSSMIALAMMLPGFQRDLRALTFAGLLKSIYAVGLVGVIVWSGVRAVALMSVLIVLVSLWLSFRPTNRSLRKFLYTVGALGVVAVIGAVVLWQSGIVSILLERLEGGDGRIFLWQHYSGVLLRNPLGLGFGFESIVQSDQIILGQRLPPHNTLLEMGMYGGWAGVLVHGLVLVTMGLVILRTRRAHRFDPLPLRLQALILGWLASVFTLFFAGLIFTDFAYVLLSALLLAELLRDRARRKALCFGNGGTA